MRGCVGGQSETPYERPCERPDERPSASSCKRPHEAEV